MIHGQKMPYHVELPDLKLPPPWNKGPNWVKADMIYALSLSRIDRSAAAGMKTAEEFITLLHFRGVICWRFEKLFSVLSG